MVVNEIKKSENVVQIPIIWRKTICGSKARIVYDKNYGVIDTRSIPSTTVKIIVKGNYILLYSDKRFRKNNNYLAFINT